ncbi:MAG: IS5/IS1182 family transposase, partial [Bacteroidota bacterium]
MSVEMLGKLDRNPPLDLFKIPLVNFINQQHHIVQLAQQVEWELMENELSAFYSNKGRASVPIRKIAGLLILKRMFNESDES